MSMIVALFIVVGGIVALGALVAWTRARRRRRAGRVPEGERVLRRAEGCSARVFVSRDVIGGPSADRTNRGAADVVITERRLLVATWQGRVLELTVERGGSVRCTGPRRLVIEGERPAKQGAMHVRAELIVPDAEVWAALAAEHLATRSTASVRGD